MSGVGKDSNEVIEFMSLFQRLRTAVADNPKDLARLAEADAAVKRLCGALGIAAACLGLSEKAQRRLFAAPVDPVFVATWRDYQARYKEQVGNIFWSDQGFLESASFVEKKWGERDLWEMADEDAREDASAFEEALQFAFDEVAQEHRDFGPDFRNRIEDAETAWDRLKFEVGVDMRGVFRRRELVPFVLIPRQVARNYGGSLEEPSLLVHLQQAHDAFVLGVPFAALALMRSVLEATLKVHYRAVGKDLKERIDNCVGLPPRCSPMALHDLRTLANAMLHFDDDRTLLPKDLERKLLRFLNVLRVLIEGAPETPGVNR